MPLDPLLETLLDTWDRHNAVLINLARLVPAAGLQARALPGSPTVAAMFSHMHHERMVSVQENAPEHAGAMPATEWNDAGDVETLAAQLAASGACVRAAVAGRVTAGRPFDLDYAHPTQLVSFLIFHEGYHHGQIKLALKAAGMPISDAEAGPVTWKLWRAR